MKKYLNDVIIVIFLALLLLIFYFYNPPQVKKFHQKVNQSQPLILDEVRLNLVKEYANFVADGLPATTPKLYFYWYAKQRKLADLRVKKAIEEIKNTTIEPGKIKIWSLLNMGVVIKTSGQTIAIDTANLPFSMAHNQLADLADIFIVTHADGDHFDAVLLNKALAQNKKVVFSDQFFFNGKKPDNIIKLASGETKTINSVKITAYHTDHRGDGNFAEGAWYLIEVDGFKLLHTGDGRDFKNKAEQAQVYAMKDFDILLGNIMLHPYNLRDLHPKVLVSLHLFKFMHDFDLYQESTIEKVLQTHHEYEKDLQAIEKVYLLPGESFTYPFVIKPN